MVIYEIMCVGWGSPFSKNEVFLVIDSNDKVLKTYKDAIGNEIDFKDFMKYVRGVWKKTPVSYGKGTTPKVFLAQLRKDYIENHEDDNIVLKNVIIER